MADNQSGVPDPFDTSRDGQFEAMRAGFRQERENNERNLGIYLTQLEKLLGQEAVERYANSHEGITLSNLEGLFHIAIKTKPDDDTIRLVYADWLEEQGGQANAARAEFIRVQCELARMPLNNTGRPALLEQQRDLLAQYHDQWANAFLNTLPANHGLDARFIIFERGFPALMAINADMEAAQQLHKYMKDEYRNILTKNYLSSPINVYAYWIQMNESSRHVNVRFKVGDEMRALIAAGLNLRPKDRSSEFGLGGGGRDGEDVSGSYISYSHFNAYGPQSSYQLSADIVRALLEAGCNPVQNITVLGADKNEIEVPLIEALRQISERTGNPLHSIMQLIREATPAQGAVRGGGRGSG